MTLCPMQLVTIIAKTLTGKSTMLQVDLCSTVKELKLMIQGAEGEMRCGVDGCFWWCDLREYL